VHPPAWDQAGGSFSPLSGIPFRYPNLIPLSASRVAQVVAAVEPFAFERIYGAWWDRIVAQDAKQAVARSAERYLRAIADRI
jgi:hypothetical protein